MIPGELTTGKKLLYSVTPVLAILMCLFFGFFTVLAFLIFGPLNQGLFNQGFMTQAGGDTSAASLLWLLGIIPLAAIVAAIIFNFKIIRMVYGKTGPSARLWKINSVIVTIAIGLMLLSTLVGTFLFLRTDFPISDIVRSVVSGLVQNFITAAIMLYPYWLRRKLGLSAVATASVGLAPVAPPPAGLAAAPTELPGSNLQSESGPVTTPAPAAPSDTPKPQS